jgi:hypothetical protein
MIPAHHTESKMSPATQGRIAFWRLQRNSINQIWIVVRRSRAIHWGLTQGKQPTDGFGSDTEPSCHVDPNDGRVRCAAKLKARKPLLFTNRRPEIAGAFCRVCGSLILSKFDDQPNYFSLPPAIAAT